MKKFQSKLKQHHHVRLMVEFSYDCGTWLQFLEHVSSVSRPFIDFTKNLFTACDLGFFTDASLDPLLGFGCVFDSHWTFGKWELGFIEDNKPSICYLELFALCAGIFTWQEELRDVRIVIFCDN